MTAARFADLLDAAFPSWSRSVLPVAQARRSALMDGLIAEAASRGQVGLQLVSVHSTVVRAHHDCRGLAARSSTVRGRATGPPRNVVESCPSVHELVEVPGPTGTGEACT